MTIILSQTQFDQLWRQLRRLGLSTYEARAYVVLLGHPQFRAVDLAPRAGIPKQKVYDVLDQLAEKGFATIGRGRTKLFSAVHPAQAIPAFIERQRRLAEQQLLQMQQTGESLVEMLQSLVQVSDQIPTGLDYVKILQDPVQAAVSYRELLGKVKESFRQFLCPPYNATSLETELLLQALTRGVRCRLLVQKPTRKKVSHKDVQRLIQAGAELRLTAQLPLKLMLFDQAVGMCALRDPVVTHPGWTTLQFSHPGMLEAMSVVFDHYWERGTPWGEEAKAEDAG